MKSLKIIVNCFGKVISKALLLIKPLYIFSAANSGDLINGMRNSFLSVMGVLINPGEIKETLTLCFLKSKYKLSAKLDRAAFEGPYPLEFGRPRYPAIDETIEI